MGYRVNDKYRPDTYVRVNGRINSFSNRVSVVGHSIRPITDFNEITYHLLDTIHTHLTFAKPSAVSINISSGKKLFSD